jgi:methionyl-tRNA formyltransferase
MADCSVLLFSSDEIAIPLMETLHADGRFDVVGLICQPDKGVELGVKKVAERLGVKVYQPEKLSELEWDGEVPDFSLTLAYGQMLNEKWLGLAKVETLNVHFSLLPKYRGAAPIQAAILNGDKETGISLFRMVKKLDAGPVYATRTLAIEDGMTSGVLYDAFANASAAFVPDELIKMKNGEGEFAEQSKDGVSFCEKIKREDGEVDFKKSAEEILRMFRAYSPWPGLFTTYLGKRLKLVDIEVSDKVLEPGEVSVLDRFIFIGTADGSIKVKKLQLEGKQCLDAEPFILGQRGFSSSRLPS